MPSQLPAPTPSGPGFLAFVDHCGRRWQVHEAYCDGAFSEPVLLFSTATMSRRVAVYPADWNRLSANALIRLSTTAAAFVPRLLSRDDGARGQARAPAATTPTWDGTAGDAGILRFG